MREKTGVTLAASGLLLVALIDLGFRLTLERSVFPCNTGVFWGIRVASLPLYLGIGVSLALVAHIFRRARGVWTRLGALAILLGGVVNALDRLVSGCILDYLAWPGPLSAIFPNFNLSDMLILLGGMGLAAVLWVRSNRSKRTESRKSP